MDKERGQSLVELAISLVFLLLLVVGAVEIGMTFFQFIQLRDASQEGALYGSINPNQISQIEQRVRASSNSPIDLTSPEVIVDIKLLDKDGNTVSSSACQTGGSVNITVSYSHHVFLPFFTAFTGITDIPIKASVVDTLLQDC